MLVGGLLARMSRRIPHDPNTLKLTELIRTIKVFSYIPVRRFPPFRNAGLFSPEYSRSPGVRLRTATSNDLTDRTEGLFLTPTFSGL